MKKLSSLVVAIAMLGLASCKKDEKQQNPASKSRATLLTQSTWNAESMRTVTKLNGFTVIDSTASMTGTIKFYTNNIVVGEIDGEPADTSSYQLNGDTITIDDMNYYIHLLTEKNMQLDISHSEQLDSNMVIEVSNTLKLKR